jgi:hypothetical protein
MGRLIEIRNELRQRNLHDTEEPPLPGQEIPADLDPSLRDSRTVDGTFNDLHYPTMGAAGRRFGRNFPLEHVAPDTANLLVPNPREVSRQLMTRDQFQPATILNLLAAAWIQFMVHDWFVHKRSTADVINIPVRPGDDWGSPNIQVPRTEPDPAPAGSRRPPAYANLNSHYNGQLEKVDLMTGLFAEPLPPGFGFSESAFRIFVLMASRRLKSDRFFTDDYRAEIYTEFGLEYLKNNSMLSVLRRHYPQVAPALDGVENAFHPWKKITAGM